MRSFSISRSSPTPWKQVVLRADAAEVVKMSPLKEQLRALLQQKSVCHGEFTLASGAKSDFYVDARVTTMDPRGAQLIGQVGWQLVKETSSTLGRRVTAIGGPTLGGDPVALRLGSAAEGGQ